MKWDHLPEWKRAVVKVGSALIAPDGKGCKTRRLLPIARFISENMEQGREVILVTSGAVAAGMSELGSEAFRRRSIPEKQALAAIGQSLLMSAWGRLFDCPCAQILLTHDDLQNRKRFVNAKNTLNELIRLKTLPIINENDSVAVDELKVGDNDNLAAHVAVLAEADLLLILSDIDGLYDKNPHQNPDARLLQVVDRIDAGIHALAGGTHRAIATGGMTTKIQAAEKATHRGIDTVIANGSKGETLEALLAGECRGTLFKRTASPLAAKKHWMLHALPCSGRILVDAGAVKALRDKGASLLPSGVLQCEGEFRHGDAVEIVGLSSLGEEVVARGLTQYGSDVLGKIKGCQTAQIADILGFVYTDVVIHRGDMILYDCVA